MSKKNKCEIEHKGTIHVYGAKPVPQKSFFDTLCEWIGAIFVIFLVLAVIGSCSKEANSTAKAGGVKPPVTREAALSLYTSL